MPKASTSATRPRRTSMYQFIGSHAKASRATPPRSVAQRRDGRLVDCADEVDVPCFCCSAILPTREALGEHLRIKHAKDGVCEICTKKPQNLAAHCIVHAGALPVRCNLTLNITIDGERSVVVSCPYRCAGNIVAHNIQWHGKYATSSENQKNSKKPFWPTNAVLKIDYLLDKPHGFLSKHSAFAEKFEEDVWRAWVEQVGTEVTSDIPVVVGSPKVKVATLKAHRKGRENEASVEASESSATSDTLWEPVLVPSNRLSTPTLDSDNVAVPHYYCDGFNYGPSTFHSVPVKLSPAYPRQVLANISIWGIYDRLFNLPF